MGTYSGQTINRHSSIIWHCRVCSSVLSPNGKLQTQRTSEPLSMLKNRSNPSNSTADHARLSRRRIRKDVVLFHSPANIHVSIRS